MIRILVNVAVAAGLLTSLGSAAKIGDESFKITDQKREAFGFGSQCEQLLFEIQIERQGAGKIVRKCGGVGGGNILLRAGDVEQIGVQSNRARSFLGRRVARFVVDEENIGLQEGTFLIQANDFEALATFGHKVEAAIRVFFYDGDDFRSAADVGKAMLKGANYAERTALGETFADHLFVARLEDVQGQGSTGKEDDIERE